MPENRADPQSRLIALPVTRIKARSANPAEPIFRLEGGPGLTNMQFSKASRFADDHDVVLVGYRGVDGSSALDCPEVESALKRSTDFLAEESLQAYADGFRACTERLGSEGVDLAGYSLPQRVDDLESARAAFGYDRIDLLSESAGTRTAMIYTWRYPESIHRSVMIGVNPPGNFLWDPETTDEQIGRYAELCSKDASCSRRTDGLAASLSKTGADIPDRWFFLPIKEGNVRAASFYGLAETSSELPAPIYAPTTLGSWLSADEGDASGFWFQSLAADLFIPGSFVWGGYAAAASSDFQAAREYFAAGEPKPEANLGYAATAFGWGGGRLADAWPAAPDAAEYSRVQKSEVETLLIGGALDFATPPQVARNDLLPSLPNGHQVVLPGFGHTFDFWTDQPEAGSRLINTFLDSGRVDDSLYRPQRPAMSSRRRASLYSQEECRPNRERQMSNDDAQAPPSPDAALERLDRLVGTWTLKGHLVGSDEENIRGEISFEWLEGGFFLQQDAEIDFAGLFEVKARELIGYDPETESFASFVYSNFAPTPLPYKWDLRDDTLTISVSHGPLDATFTGDFSDDGESFSGGWRPNPGADETINIPYDVSGTRVK